MEWINVKDRLPEDSGTYLVCAEGVEENDPAIVSEAEFIWDDWYWYGCDGSHICSEFVTHWTKMPEPPIEK